MVQVKQDKFVLGQSVSKTIASLGEEIRLDLQLQPLIPTIGATVEGLVTDTNGAVIPNALVKIMDSNFEPLLHSVTDANGEYLFNNIPASNSYTIFAIAPGKKIKQGQGFSLSEGASRTINFTLEDDPAMQLAIIAGDLFQTGTTNPVGGAVVTLFEVDQNGIETLSAITHTNEFGQFVFREVANGEYSINISALGFISDSISVSVTSAPQIISVQPTLQPDPNAQNGTVSGVILDNLNAPIDRADVILYEVNADDSLTPVAFTKTNSAGVYLFINVPQGTYKVKSNELEIVEIDVDPPLGDAPNLDRLTLAEAVTVIPIMQQAMDGVLANGAVIRGVGSVSPDFVDLLGGTTNGSVTITTSVPLAGEYTLGIQHVNPQIRPLVIEVNGVAGNALDVPATASFDPADSAIFNTTVNLSQGSNTIKFLGNGTDFAPVINNITFDKNPFVDEVLSTEMILSNGAFINTNSNFVNSIGGPTAGVAEAIFNAPIAGQYNLTLFHANNNERPLRIDVNGISTGEIYQFPIATDIVNPGQFTVVVNFLQGNNVVRFYNENTQIFAPDLLKVTATQEQFLSFIEAENATLGGSAIVDGEFVVNIGGSGNGFVQTSKTVPFAGAYDFIITYVAANPNKTARILVNNVDTGILYTFEQTDSLNIADAKTKVVRLTLNAGANTIRFI